MKELGVFCGTFNPIHWGHLLLAECARDQFHLYKVLFITSPRPPHRSGDLLPALKRHAMVEAAVSGNPFFKPSRLEIDRRENSYTVDTLLELKGIYGGSARLNLIVGGDNVPALTRWHRAGELFQLCRLLVAPRLVPSGEPGQESLEPQTVMPESIQFATIDCPPTSVSSSEIRRRLRAGKSVLYMVPAAVNEILLAEKHYNEPA